MVIKKTKRLIKEYPSHTVIASLLLTIITGALCLALPICQKVSTSLIDIIFLATSLTTVTGLKTVPFDNFTHIGQCVMLVLMQIGG